MSTREQFGKYLLLKKLTEDPLGETFRAGMLGSKGMERVALLRIFNGQGLDSQRLWEASRGRAPIQQQLRSPNLGEGIEMGEIQGIPYVAYDYVSGKNLATLLEQAAKKRNFIPTEHALLITERVALALAAACENRYEGARILHGFLIPHLVMISNEGETRLLGFEVAPGLRSFAGNPVVRQHFGRYLAPEALAGAPPDRADDIYSLGVILFELLTGKPLPPPGPDGFGSVIDQGVLATEGEPIPPELADLLKRSLVAREQRVNDIVGWHKALNKWMFDGQYNPTTFNLAFYMHNLFRQEIERESQEIQVERTMPLPVVQPQAPTPSPSTPSPAAEEPEAQEGTDVSMPPPAVESAPRKSNTGLLIGLAALIAVILGGGIFWWTSQKAPEPASVVAAQPELPPPPPPAPVIPEEEVDAGPSEDEQALQAQIEELIKNRASDMEAQIRAEYDKQLKDLESKLAEASAARERERQRREVERRAREEQEALEIAQQEAAQATVAEEEGEEEPVVPEEDPAEVAEVEPPPEEILPPPPPVVPPPPPAPKPTQVRRGDLVELSESGVVPPTAQRMVQPRFPEPAKRVNKRSATVSLRVLIDENGKVIDAELEGDKKQGFGFDEEALRAARKSTFNPATKNGVPVKVWYPISVVFRQ